MFEYGSQATRGGSHNDGLVIRAADVRPDLERAFESAGVPGALSVEFGSVHAALGVATGRSMGPLLTAFCSAVGVSLSPEEWDGPLLTGTAWPI